ncbi:MAG: hypothetical protein K8T89_18540 [Planctomycetes bacterium]|nr:hypothetical protein [Planctomycetota bacterium]
MFRLSLLALMLCGASVVADERDEMIAKQKMVALDVLKKCEIASPVLIETQDLIVCGPFPEAKLRTMGDQVQKAYAVALKALKFEKSESPPKGKLAIYFLPERKHYAAFVGVIVNDRLEKDDRSHVNGQGNEPYVAVGVLPGEKPTDLDVEASTQVAVALLFAKAGANELPAWIRLGFARAIQMRTDPKFAGDKAAVRKLLYETKAKPGKYKVGDVWMPPLDKEKQLLAASLMEYLVFGSESSKLGQFLSNMRPVEGSPIPKADEVLKSLELPVEKLDVAWKKYVQTGK